MIGRILLYGLAFGSATAAMVLIQYYNGLNSKPGSLAAFFPFILNMVIPAVGIYLFVKSMIINPGKSPLNLGKALFFSLLVGVVISLCSVGAYTHIYKNKPEIITAQKAVELEGATKFVFNNSDIKVEDRAAKIEEAKVSLNKKYEIYTFGFFQTGMILSVTMVVALLIFLYNFKKQ
jgi:hypothetical protein